MANTLEDLLNAIDSYMIAKGKATEPYIAKKVSELFESDESMFNPKAGPIKVMWAKFNTFTKAIEDATKQTAPYAKKLTEGLTKLNEFYKNISTASSDVKMLISRLGGLSNANKRPPGRPVSYNPYDRLGEHIVVIRSTLRRISNTLDDLVYTTRSEQNFEIVQKTLLYDVSATALYKLHGIMETALWRVMRSTVLRDRNLSNGLYRSHQSDDEGGIISNIMGWMTTIGLFIGGVFALTKAGDFFTNNKLGISIKESVTDFISKTADKIGKAIDDGTIADSITNTITFIGNVIKKTVKGTISFIRQHWDNIESTLVRIVGTIWNDIAKPMGRGIMNHIIYPLFGAIKKDIQESDWSGAALKGIGAAFLATFIPGISSVLSGTFSGIGAALGPIIAGARTLLFTPLGVAITAAASAVTFAVDRINGFNKAQEEIVKTLEERHTIEERGMKTYYDNQKKKRNRIQELESTPNRTSKQDLEIKLLRAQMEYNRIQANKNAELNSANAKLGTLSGAFAENWMGSITKEIDGIHKKYESQYNEQDSYIRLLNDRLKSAESSEKVRQKKKADSDAVVDQILSNRKSPTPTSVKDAIIIQPHSKDQIIAGKMDGPFDKALTYALNELSLLKNIMAEVGNLIASTTATGNHALVQAIAASAQASTSGASALSNRGGSDPIRDLRQRVAAHTK